MTKYRINFTTTAEASVTVEADDFEAAVDKAYDQVAGLQPCAQCQGWNSGRPGIYLGEFEANQDDNEENTVVK